MSAGSSISVNARATALVEGMAADATALRIGVSRGELGETLIDVGSGQPGGIAAGLYLAEICMGGLGTVTIIPNASVAHWPWSVVTRSSQPVIACLASQVAGWRLSHGSGADAFFALGSGPARALARKDPIFETIDYKDDADTAVLVIEGAKPPPAALVAKVADDCGVHPGRLTILYAPTRSLAGAVQIVARSLEVAMHKAAELKFPVERIVDGMGTAPLCPPHPDQVVAMGRTNDAIIYASQVQLFVTGRAEDARALAEQLPSEKSRDYGRPFADIFKAVKGDFYAIDPMLFSPAEVIVTAIETGESFRAGRVNPDMLDASFGT
jgi:methenyltetrahydromethanopterin cyclohydrolase